MNDLEMYYHRRKIEQATDDAVRRVRQESDSKGFNIGELDLTKLRVQHLIFFLICLLVLYKAFEPYVKCSLEFFKYLK